MIVKRLAAEAKAEAEAEAIAQTSTAGEGIASEPRPSRAKGSAACGGAAGGIDTDAPSSAGTTSTLQRPKRAAAPSSEAERDERFGADAPWDDDPGPQDRPPDDEEEPW
jgi:hypothetical protein